MRWKRKMKKQKKLRNNNLSGVLLYAKKSGPTSFSSLWSIKHALGTDRVGHTGTLDSFAEGLLVVLAGHLTHLVPHVTGFTKTYRAVINFGTETDTLDPGGKIIRNATPTDRESLEKILPQFTGALLQVPPVYSAVHVDGKRASDAIRRGEDVKLESRQVFVYENKLLDFLPAESTDGKSAYALLEIKCSKGTYIRALARDIAQALGTCAHLSALRRTQVGPFSLSDAAGFDELEDFTIENGIRNEERFASLRNERGEHDEPNEKDKKSAFKKPDKNRETDSDGKIAEIQSHLLTFTPELARECGFRTDSLKSSFEKQYLNGRPLSPKFFTWISSPEKDGSSEFSAGNQIAVFYSGGKLSGKFAGIIVQEDFRLSYGFVVPKSAYDGGMKIFTWKQILDGAFPIDWRKKGSAISVGSFDGVHAGHQKLLENLLASGFVPGALIFSSPVRSSQEGFAGEIDGLERKLEILSNKGLSFAVVIDFSPDFSKMDGETFIGILKSKLGLSLLAEGRDFKCGFGGKTDMEKLSELARKIGFELCTVDDVEAEGLKVSSSNIRESILKADFALVRKMLLRPFSYSCSGMEWIEEKSDGKGTVFRAKKISPQILPSDGSYEVSAVLSSVPTDSVFKTFCTVDAEKITLTLPDSGSVSRLKEILFA